MRSVYKLMVRCIWLLVIGSYAFAASEGAGFGAVAKNLMEPVSLFSSFIDAACFLIGGSFLFASVIKYVEQRRSPLMVPISTVIFLLIAGVLLVLLPFLANFMEG